MKKLLVAILAAFLTFFGNPNQVAMAKAQTGGCVVVTQKTNLFTWSPRAGYQETSIRVDVGQKFSHPSGRDDRRFFAVSSDSKEYFLQQSHSKLGECDSPKKLIGRQVTGGGVDKFFVASFLLQKKEQKPPQQKPEVKNTFVCIFDSSQNDLKEQKGPYTFSIAYSKVLDYNKRSRRGPRREATTSPPGERCPNTKN